MDAIIGGTGLNQLRDLEDLDPLTIDTPWGKPSGAIQRGMLGSREVCFLARHGQPHALPPHRINYRANIAALKSAGVKRIIAVNAVGGIHDHLAPGALAVPDQIIDYTSGREHTFYDGTDARLEHVDFTEPYTQSLRLKLIRAAKVAGVEVLPCGTYAATNGPRLETAAEVLKIRQDGGDCVGMTGMPEAVLAREAELEYACLALSVNWAAGLQGLTPITMSEIERSLQSGMDLVKKILMEYFSS